MKVNIACVILAMPTSSMSEKKREKKPVALDGCPKEAIKKK